MTIHLIPPPIINKFQYNACKQVNNPVTGKRSYLTPDGESLPSVTTILSATKDMTHLNEWKERVGHATAQKITSEASVVGSGVHANLEKFLRGTPRMPGNNPIHVKANAMADIIIQNGLKDVSEVWALEQSLYFPGLFSGTTDGIGVYKGNPVVFDFKQTNKPKKVEWIEDYFLQLVAYMMAHNEVYGTDIKEGHIFMVSRGNDPLVVGGEEYQQFTLLPSDYLKYQDLWLTRIEDYYKLQS